MTPSLPHLVHLGNALSEIQLVHIYSVLRMECRAARSMRMRMPHIVETTKGYSKGYLLRLPSQLITNCQPNHLSTDCPLHPQIPLDPFQVLPRHAQPLGDVAVPAAKRLLHALEKGSVELGLQTDEVVEPRRLRVVGAHHGEGKLGQPLAGGLRPDPREHVVADDDIVGRAGEVVQEPGHDSRTVSARCGMLAHGIIRGQGNEPVQWNRKGTSGWSRTCSRIALITGL